MPIDPNFKLTRETFAQLSPMVTDGAWGTEMQKLGAQPGQMCDTWNVDAPEKVYQVARSYVDAGSDVILTNTFNCNRIILAKHGLEGRVFELNKAGAELSKKAAVGRAYVFASIGPTGKLAMMGEMSPEDLEEVFAEQARGLEAGGADAIVVETQSDIVEAEAGIVGAMKATQLPVGVSFTFDAGAGGAYTMMGVSVAKAYEMARRVGASFVGANCGRGIETFVSIAKLFAECEDAATRLPIWIKGNAGLPEHDSATGKTVYRATPQVYLEAVKPLLDAGARFVGGCCGSNPDHIKAVAIGLAKARGCGCGCCGR